MRSPHRVISRAMSGVPPEVEDVDDDADGCGGKLLGEVVGFFKREDDGALGGVHGVEGFDAELDVVL